MSARRLTAVFDDDERVLAATQAAREGGFKLVDVYTPFPVHGMDEAMGLRPSYLTWACFLFGFAGLALALWFQFWTSAIDWPINVGGKPFDSLPAFVPIAFEVTVLFAGLGVVIALLVRCRLWPGKRVEEPAPGVTDDRFAIVVKLKGAVPTEEDFRELMASHGALAVTDGWDGERSWAA